MSAHRSSAAGTAVEVAAVDLGATSGRVILGHVTPSSVRLQQISRFPNHVVQTPDGLHWNILELWRNIVDGLADAARETTITSIGIDSWAVDYALMSGGRMLATPYHYRDPRTDASAEAVHELVPFAELYRQNGLQFLPFNTLYQLRADRDAGALMSADAVLLIPDLFGYWMTGEQVTEMTNASTTGLLRVGSAQAGHPEWNASLAATLDIPRGLLRPLVDSGTAIGGLLPYLRGRVDTDARVTTVGSHDTASAVVAIPMTHPDAAYISCGTWGLVGVELEHPVLSDAAREANFTNEGGVDGRVRFLHNVMGLWLLTESIRGWERDGETVDLEHLLSEAASFDGEVAVFDPNDPRFLTPGDMPRRIADWCSEHGIAAPDSHASFARSILESLAQAFADAVRTAADLSGKRVNVIHIVGGGSQNDLLCRLTATRAELPVLAGPVEATALGNVLVQARAAGVLTGDLESMRALIARDHAPRRYDPDVKPSR